MNHVEVPQSNSRRLLSWERSIPLLVLFLAALASFIIVFRLFSIPGEVAPLPNVSGIDNETAVLRAQLDVIRSYEQRQIQYVTWALGSLVTVAAILAGFSWYMNKDMHEREINALRTVIADESKTLERQITLSHDDAIREARRIGERWADDIQNLDRRFGLLEADLLQVRGDNSISQGQVISALHYRLLEVRRISGLRQKVLASPNPFVTDLNFMLSWSLDRVLSTLSQIKFTFIEQLSFQSSQTHLESLVVEITRSELKGTEPVSEDIRTKIDKLNESFQELVEKFSEMSSD